MRRMLSLLPLFFLAVAAGAQGAAPDPRALGAIGGEGIPVADGIEVASLLADGAGRKSGLATGDVIQGVGSRPVSAGEDPFLVLTDLIEKPRKAGKPVVLRVRRGKKTLKLDLVIDAAVKKPKSTFASSPRYVAIRKAALAKLAAMQHENGAFPTKLGGNNGLTAVTSIAGLAFIAAGNSTKEGEYRETLSKVRDWLVENAGTENDAISRASGRNWSQVNWALGYASLCLSRIHALDPSRTTEAKLVRMKDALLANMEKTGGWAHGPSSELPYPLDYAELTACGNICLAGLGEIRSLGIDVPKEKIALAIDYIQKSSDGAGGVGYSTRAGQRGQGATGRSASALLALSRLGMDRHPFMKKLAGYVRANLKDTPHGHVSPDFHYFFVAQACRTLGKKDWTTFVKLFRTEILSLWNGDGTFGVRPADTSRSGFPNTDRTMGPAWRTATFAMILALESERLDRPAGTLLPDAEKKK